MEIPADRLDYAFKISKYPVTNAQYRRFVEAGAYDREQGWFSEEAQREILEWEDGRWPTSPRYEGNSRFTCASQPVIGVSWYEASAYEAWLTTILRQEGKLRDDEVVRLARVAEWERAAGGSGGRKYSWEGAFDSRHANTRECALGQPTPVHMYPAGATPEGVWDLTGNVWEWTADSEEEPWYTLAGGAFWNDAGGVGAAARGRNVRYGWGDLVGFRVVVAPISCS